MGVQLDRRAFLRRTAVVAAGTWAAGWWVPGVATARERTRGVAAAPEGTTLARTLVPGDAGGYVRLAEGPGEPVTVRGELAEPRRGRDDRRRALATVAHLTDIHVVDAQSPARVEFLDRLEEPGALATGALTSAQRSQETLCGHVAEAMVRRLRQVGVGPVSGRPFDCAVSTGDNTDNQQENELDWFLGLLDGGRPVACNSGDEERYEGVQDDDPVSYDASYWHPDTHPAGDVYKRDYGFPEVPGLLDVAVSPFAPAGLPCPWFSVHGNHDGLVQGNVPDLPALEEIAVGPLKVVGPPDGLSPARMERLLAEGDLETLLGGSLPRLAEGDLGAARTALQVPVRAVTPDPRRRFLSRAEYAAKHRERRDGPGPVGHGLDEEAAATGRLYYTFEIADEVLGIALDTVNPGGYASGSLDRAQLSWLEARLAEVHARHDAPDGTEVATDHGDRLVVVFAHHNLDSMANPVPHWQEQPAEERVDGDELAALLHRFPNVVAFVNGHSHRNRVTAHPDPAGRGGGFWECNTAAHIDHPQQSRIVEVVDNADGTLSLFATMLDHAGPARPPAAPGGVLELAALSRELACNDPQGSWDRAGAPGDRNVELLLPAPFDPAAAAAPSRQGERAGGPATGERERPATPGGRHERARDAADTPAAGAVTGTAAGAAARPRAVQAADRELPATGGSTVAGAGALLLAGTLALRRRGAPGPPAAGAPADTGDAPPA